MEGRPRTGGAEAEEAVSSLAWLHGLTIVRQIDSRPLVNLGVFYRCTRRVGRSEGLHTKVSRMQALVEFAVVLVLALGLGLGLERLLFPARQELLRLIPRRHPGWDVGDWYGCLVACASVAVRQLLLGEQAL
eukprot:COSAG01_NODE_3905_length_5559_cov_13.718498_5_plen_132_part_00